MPVQFWRDIVGKRLDWIEQPREELLRKLEGNEFQNGLASHEQITICLWGPTQVGKTTLLLKVLGIREGALPEVAAVLRGGRNMGNSSTSCPIRYNRSTCSKWFVGGDSGQLDGEAAMARFTELREQISIRRQSDDLSVLDVLIPDNYFDVSDQSKLISVIDLPGFDAAELSEAEYVQKLAKKYLPGADLVLLVVKASNLSFLRGDNLQIDELSEWYRFPDKYRLVPTYSFSAGSFKSFFAKGENRNLPAIRQHLATEIITFQTGRIQNGGEIEKLIFPMEYGDSWESYKQGEGNPVDEAAAIISCSLSGIRESITQSSSRLSRLRSTAKFQSVINSISIAREQQLDAEISDRISAVKIITRKIEELSSNHQKLIDEGRGYISSAEIEESFLSLMKEISNKFYPKMPDPSKSDGVAGLQRIISEMQSAARLAWLDAEKLVVEHEIFCKIPIVFEAPDFYVGDDFDEIGEVLKNYSINYYFLDVSYLADYDCVCLSYLKLMINLRSRFFTDFEIFEKLCVEYVCNEEREFNNKLKKSSSQLEGLIQKLDAIDLDIFELNQKKEYLVEHVDKINNGSKEFILDSKRNFNIQFDENWSHLLGGDNIFYRSLYALLMIKEYKYIFEVD